MAVGRQDPTTLAVGHRNVAPQASMTFTDKDMPDVKDAANTLDDITGVIIPNLIDRTPGGALVKPIYNVLQMGVNGIKGATGLTTEQAVKNIVARDKPTSALQNLAKWPESERQRTKRKRVE